MTEQHRRDKGTLLLAFIVGLSVHGTFSALFNSAVHFSVFPVLALCLAVYCFHQRYLNLMLPEGMPKLVTGTFFLGLFSYNALMRAEYPEAGSNYFSAVFIVIIALWLYRAMKQRRATGQDEVTE